MTSSIGVLFRVTTFGESHGTGVGAVVEGCPPGMPLCREEVQAAMDRRRPGQSALTTPRDEKDAVELLSGIDRDRTLGTPIGMLVRNRDQRPGDYRGMQAAPRPSHADYTYRAKFGVAAASGGGRASARETIGRVAGGAVAGKYLAWAHDVHIVAWVSAVGTVQAPDMRDRPPTRNTVDAHPVRCPDPESAARMAAAIEQARDAGDSVGGLITCVCSGVPAGWGDPVFGKLEALLAGGMLSIPACRGFEIGSGFAAASMQGSAHNDPFVLKGGRLGTASNYSGGVQGGISNGEAIVFRVAFKPPATIGKPQATADYQGQPVTVAGHGRHDPCVAPRAVPVVEAMAALVLADAALRQASLSRKENGHETVEPLA